MSRHYLDHASTSPLRPAARAALIDALDDAGADPGRIHTEGMRARYALEAARNDVAAFLGARPREVVFTSSATEAIVTATRGGIAYGGGSNVLVSAVEHSAVRKAVAIEAPNATVCPVDGTGVVDPDEVVAALTADTALVCLQLANHEVGSLQPVAEVVSACRDAGVLTLVDAAMAVGHVPFSFRDLGADLVAVSAHKFGGPPGIGALLVRRGLRIDPLLVGGDQERARRAGLEDLPAAAGFAAACRELADPARLDREIGAAAALTDRVRTLVHSIDGTVVFGPDDPTRRVSHLVCVGIEGVEPQGVLLGLDQRGIACHSGSSCSSESLEPSPVLEAMGVDAHRSLRISVGWSSTPADIDALEIALPDVIARLRSLGGQLP